MITARYVRAVAAISLVLNAVLSVVAIALMPVFSNSNVEYLATIDAAGSAATISAAAFVIAQLPLMIAVLGLSHLAGIRAPIISIIGGTIAVIGAFGHAAYGATRMLTVSMAADTANHDVYAGLLDGEMPLPLMILMMCGTSGNRAGAAAPRRCPAARQGRAALGAVRDLAVARCRVRRQRHHRMGYARIRPALPRHPRHPRRDRLAQPAGRLGIRRNGCRARPPGGGAHPLRHFS